MTDQITHTHTHTHTRAQFLPFERLRNHGCIPRSSDMCHVTLESLRAGDVKIFVSHRWLCGSAKPAHPDDAKARHPKHALIVEAVERMQKQGWIPTEDDRIMLWVDFTCVDQDSDHPAMELNDNMAKIIGLCDAMLTPVVDAGWQAWSKRVTREQLQHAHDPLSSYKARNWHEYADRGWCRLEMFFSANVPVPEDQTRRLRGPLMDALKEQRRPHLVFGDRERALGEPPILLPKLDDKLYRSYLPTSGKLFNPKDKKIIGDNVQELEEINKRLKDIRIENLKALDLNGAEYTAQVTP
jgi:hypothetical protein